jgi:fused signal recognition particle receptor
MGFFSSLRKLWTGGQETSAVQDRTPAAPSDDGDWRADLTVALREAKPCLSSWLDAALRGVDEAGDVLWERLRFLLVALDAPDAEAEAFIREFQAWAGRMEYRYVGDFRSELQYRLALALDMEDEQDERDRLFLKVHEGLSRTREQFGRSLSVLLAGHGDLGRDFWDALEEVFIRSDIGVETATELIGRLKKRAQSGNARTPEALRPLITAEFADIFKTPRRVTAVNPPEVVLVIGVNGVGKTTTIAKLAYRARMQGKKTLLIAADTFRAAAVEQLRIWAGRVGADFHAKDAGADPAAVTWEGMDTALARGHDIVFVDTAGRLHTKTNLMEELKKVRSVIARKHPGAPHRAILVLDASTGQNALAQARIFKDNCGIDELILTKLDGTAKGGMALSIALRLGIPITYIGLGEKMEDLRPFNGEDFARALVGAAV